MLTPLGLDHVVLRVRDQEASRRFYTEVLGCTVDRVNERLSLIHLRFGEAFIDLVPAAAGEPRGGVDHICLSIACGDLVTLSDELRGRGVKLESAVVSRYGAWGQGPSIYLRDPDDYLLELKPR